MPPRSMWKGAISFGLVTIPVAVYPATEEKSLKFNQLHDEDMGRIRYKRVCSVDGEEVEFDHIVKGFEVEKDKYVVLTDEDFDAVPVESSRAIDIQQFVDLEEIDPILFKKSYYLVPDETGAKAYALLRKALSDERKVGIAKVSFRDKEHLSALRFKDDVFVLETMYWPDEVRAAEFDTVPADEKVRENEVDMARSLIESLTEPWNPEAFTDAYREAMLRDRREEARRRADRGAHRRGSRARRRPDGGPEGLGGGGQGQDAVVGGRRQAERREATGGQEDRGQARDRDEEGRAAQEGVRRVSGIDTGPRLAG